MEDDVELPENRTELERLLAAACEYEHRRPRKTSLPKWLFAITLSGAVLSIFALSDVYTAVTSALVTAVAKPTVDPIAAANVAEDIDYRIAQRTKSLAGWQAFLDAHRDGPHAQAAHAEIERLLPTPPPEPDAHMSGVNAQAARAEVEKGVLAEKASSPATAPEVSYGASPDAKAASEVVDRAAVGTEVAVLTPDEICKRDGDRLERLRSSPKDDEAARFANELGCEKLRPQLLALMESLDHVPSAPAVAHPRPSVEVGSASQEWRFANDHADSNANAGGPAVEAPQMNGPNESSGVPLVKAVATPSGESGERGGRRVWRGTHHGGGWHYRIHTTGVARMSPVLVFR
jgi:hypothetical protein